MPDPIRDWIVEKLNTVPNMGTVHSYQRYAAREKQLADLYSANGQLRGWFVRRLAVVAKSDNGQTSSEQVTWLIRGYLALDDVAESELIFDELLDAVRAVFRVNESEETFLIAEQSVSLMADEQSGFAVLDSQPVLFAGVLCHSAKCQLITQRWVSY